MSPKEITLRLKPLKNGKKRISYSCEEALTIIHELGGREATLAQFKYMEETRAIPPSIFFREVPYYTFRQIHILANWFSGSLVAARNNPIDYAYQHWNDRMRSTKSQRRKKLLRLRSLGKLL